MTIETVNGPPGVGKTVSQAEANRKVFGKVGLVVPDSHGDLSQRTAGYAIRDGFEKHMIVDRTVSASVIPNYQQLPKLTSSGVQLEQDRINVSDEQRQAFMTQRGYDVVHEHPWVLEALTAAFDAMVTLDLPLRALPSLFRFGSLEYLDIVAKLPEALREKFAEFENMGKFERERVLGAGRRILGKALRGPLLRERFDHPGEKVDIDKHLANAGIWIIDGRGSSDDQFRTMALWAIMRAINGAMLHGYPVKISGDEFAPLLTPWLIRKLEEGRKWGVSVTMLFQHLPSDPELRGRLLKASDYRIWYACHDPEERRIAALDLIRALDRNKVKWTETRIQQLRRPSMEVDRVTVGKSDNGKFGLERRITNTKSVTKIEKQMLDTIETRIPHFEAGQEQLFWFEQDLAGLGQRERWVSHGPYAWFERTRWVPPLYPGCPGLAETRYLAALERIEARPYYRMPVIETVEKKGAACRLQRIQAEHNVHSNG